ncbi:hypothetical protein DBV15_10558 [Temnothorax longispinosus]|uniref:Uncharacterized protein n=1 Tax=Temnothorax longispinosus TaxID=300112 RepID=A0A4S2L9C5_9HYME|nr:hypothetical protein DBV15_10558 [Temnothorax longispinosus]
MAKQVTTEISEACWMQQSKSLPIRSHKAVPPALRYEQAGVGEELLALGRYAEVLHLDINRVVQLLITALLCLALRNSEIGLELAVTLPARPRHHLHRPLVLLLLLQLLLLLVRELLARRLLAELHVRELRRDIVGRTILNRVAVPASGLARHRSRPHARPSVSRVQSPAGPARRRTP